MRRCAALLTLLFALAAAARAAEPLLVPDVSQREIEIRYSFTGAKLLLFGAIVYPGGRVPEEPPDVAVVVKGPPQPIIVREKRKVGGIWMNVDAARFRTAPAFYAIASSAPLERLVDERMAAIYELGLDNLQLSPGSGAPTEEQRRFEAGLVDLRMRAGLYVEDPGGVEMSENVLYRARVSIPARVPVGEYTAETFLIQDGEVLAAASREIRIEKLGLERFIADAARRWSLLYGLAAVAVSLLLGWAASAWFRRR
ncbi:MAG: TIGR02186 family protein [Sphingomonadaceae bacterium]